MGKSWPVFNLDFKHHIAIEVVPVADFARTKVSADKPYIVRGVDPHLADATCQGTINLWISGFDNAPAVKAKGKSQWGTAAVRHTTS